MSMSKKSKPLRAGGTDGLTDLLRGSKNDRSAVALHSGSHDHRLAGGRAELALIGLESEVELPDLLQLAVGGLDGVCVPAVLDGADLPSGRRGFKVGSRARHAHHAAAFCRGWRRLVFVDCF